MAPHTEPERRARDEFLAAYRHDLERGSLRPLSEYQALQPGFETAIAEEFALLEDEGERPATATALGPGARIASYVIERELGRGGQAVVYLARDAQLGRDVALKVLARGAAVDRRSEVFQRFQREAESTARLDHPGICTVYEAGEADGVPFIAMRHLRGETLAQRLAHSREGHQRSLPLATPSVSPTTSTPAATGTELHPVLWMVEQCARALHFAHEHGLVHRDVKPGNILLQDDGAPVLLDFGIASLAGDDHALTRSGAQLGTPYYMASEQVLGRRADRRTDVYALGVILYECLTLRRPFEAPAREPLYALIVAAHPQPARQLNPRIPRDLQVVLETAMDKEPQRRYPTALALAEDLERLRRFEPIRARPIGPILRARRWSQRHPVRSVALLIGTLALLVALLLWNRAATALDDWGRLADRRRVAELVERADDELWPATPDRIPAMRAWLQQTDLLLQRRPMHRDRLAQLRGQSLPYTDDDRRRDRARSSSGQELTRLLRGRAALAEYVARLPADATNETQSDLQAELGKLDARIAGAEAAIEAKNRYRFPDADRQFQHDALANLLGDLGALDTLRGEVLARSELAASLRQRSLEGEAAAAWQRAAEAIAAAPGYGGLALAPQLGLLPLRADPASGLWEFAHLPTGDPPPVGEAGRYQLSEATGVVLVLIPGGEFAMGDRKEQFAGIPGLQHWTNELPVHRVRLEPFLLSKYELTQSQWLRLCGSNPSVYCPPQLALQRRITLLHPVENVDHHRALDAMRRAGLGLPTEAQWEYAARGGTTSLFWTGDDPKTLVDSANLADRTFSNRPFEDWIDDGYGSHAPVGSFRANGFGLHDVAGNVWEWCRDLYGSYETAVQPGDGMRASWNIERAMRRGGGFRSMANELRCGRRLFAERSYSDGTIGLRPALALGR